MRNRFLAFLAASSVLTMVESHGEDFSPPMSAKAARENSPVLDQPIVKPAPVQPEAPVKAEEPPAAMKPIVEDHPVKKTPAGRIAKAIFSKTSDSKRLLISFNNKPKLTAQEQGDTITIHTANTVSFEPDAVPDDFKDVFTGLSKQNDNKGNLIITLNLAPNVKAKISGNKAMVLIDVPVAQKPETGNQKPQAEAAKPAAVKSGVVNYSTENEVQKLKFNFSKPVAAAVFERFGYYWLVFDTDEDVILPDSFKKSSLFVFNKKILAVNDQSVIPENFNQPPKNPQIFVLELSKEAYANATRTDNSWTVEFDPNIAYSQDKPLKLEDKGDTWQIAAKSVVDKIIAKDEVTNNLIEVYPLSDPGFVGGEVKNDSFILGKTVQGVVMQPIGRIAGKTDEKDKIKIIKPTPTPPASGAQKSQEINVVNNEDALPIFPFQKWPQLKGTDYHKAELKIKSGDRADFAKFLFSQQLYPEAEVNLAGVPGFQASFLNGASLYLSGHNEDAIKVFDSLTLPDGVDTNELVLWKAAATHDLTKTNPSIQPIDLSNFYLPKNVDNYPESIRNKLIFAITEELIDQAKYENAQGFINILGKTSLDTAGKSYVKYLQAKVDDGMGKKARARELWADVVKSNTDRESRAKAGYEIIMQDYTANKIKIDEAIKQLNGVRIVWRGDNFEYKLLKELGDLYAQNGNDFEALRTMKEILSTFPNYPDNAAITDKMRGIYENALEKQLADKETTFKAVTIYYEFEELKPTGSKGDEITLQLADALAKYDLLDDAVKVLQKYSADVTDTTQKAEVATRIAILQYLNSKPKDALETLKNSDSKDIFGNMLAERKILEIRCLIDLNELAVANSQLSGIPDEQAYKFKTDIYWKQKKWQEMLDSYALVADRDDEDIMRMAIAYALLDDKQNLTKLKTQYGVRMEKSEYSQNFDYVTNVDNVDFRNLTGSLHLDQTKKVLSEYQNKIKKGGLAKPVDKKQL